MERLYEKYRPQSLDTFYGNKQVIKTLQSYLKKDSLPHAIFFRGETGSGKTTLARILARHILGEDGLEWGLNELNMSDKTGVADARDMIDASRTVAMGGGNKVYILDEVHNISKQGQDALLKAFEDIPDHLYWIICTDSPDKLDKALVGRCQEFKLSTLTKADKVSMLQDIADKENRSITFDMAQAIAEHSSNNRKAIQNLEAVLQIGGDLEIKDVIASIRDDTDEGKEWFKSLMMPMLWPFMQKDTDPYDPDFFLPRLNSAINSQGAIGLSLAMTGYCRNRILSQKYKVKSNGEPKQEGAAQSEYQRLIIILQFLSKTNYKECMKPENNVLVDFLHLFNALRKHRADGG